MAQARRWRRLGERLPNRIQLELAGLSLGCSVVDSKEPIGSKDWFSFFNPHGTTWIPKRCQKIWVDDHRSLFKLTPFFCSTRSSNATYFAILSQPDFGPRSKPAWNTHLQALSRPVLHLAGNEGTYSYNPRPMVSFLKGKPHRRFIQPTPGAGTVIPYRTDRKTGRLAPELPCTPTWSRRAQGLPPGLRTDSTRSE